MKQNKAVIILGHGSRNKLAQQDFLDFVQAVKQEQLSLRIEHASMELSPPNIPSVISKLYNEGIRSIVVVPFFLFRGMHIVNDIPKIIEEQKVKYSNLDIVMGKVLLPDGRLKQVVIERIKEAVNV